MKLRAMVAGERVESYEGKKGHVENRMLSLLDRDKTHPLMNTFDFTLPKELAQLYPPDSLNETFLEVGITAFEPAFGGRLRAKGEIISGLPPAPAPKDTTTTSPKASK